MMHNPTYKNIKAAYSFYNVPSGDLPLNELVSDALIMAKNVSDLLVRQG